MRMKKFSDLALLPALLQNLERLNYHQPTAIQEQAIPLLLEHHDLLAIAQTGTGKTAAFCLPLLQHLGLNPKGRTVRALILVPTRELATQIQDSLEKYGSEMNLLSVAIFGGVGQASQVQAIKNGAEIIVATPGRLLDLMSQGLIRLHKVEMLVLDEADRMLDMGFMEDLEKIIENLPPERQTMFFSATMPPAVVGLSRRILKHPKKVEVAPNSSTVEQVEQKVIRCKREDKFQLLKKILKEEQRDLVVVFTKTKNSADKVKEYLRFHKLASTVYHGDKSQNEREQALGNFKSGGIKVLIATDIAARGLDIQGVSHVINFELPLEAESYVHRIGRTARAGKSGVAITFCDNSEAEILERIEKLINKRLPTENFKGIPEASGKWNQEGAIRQVKAPTPGKSQEKTAYLDHSKRQRLTPEGAPKPSKSHPGLKNRKKKR
jgi:ATP-dependent RNA helicase RhlE